METTRPLTDLQLELIKLFKYNIDDEDLSEIKNLLSQYFARKVDEEFDKLEKNKNLSIEDYSKWSYEHLRAKSE
jgi:hypothetical protein